MMSSGNEITAPRIKEQPLGLVTDDRLDMVLVLVVDGGLW